jgi:hypothetical protein
LDQWLRDQAAKNKPGVGGGAGRGLAFLFSAGTVLGLMLVIKLLNTNGKIFQEQWPAFSWMAWALSLGTCCLLACIHHGKIFRLKDCRCEVKIAVAIVSLVFMLDLLTYQKLFQLSWPRRLKSCAPIATEVYPFNYQKLRKMAHRINPHVRASAEIVAEVPHRLSVEAYHFMLFDMGIPREYPNYYWLFPVYELLESRFPQFTRLASLSDFMRYPGADVFFNVFGIASPKLRLTSNALIAPDHATALATVANTGFPIDRTIVLENVSALAIKNWKADSAQKRSGTIAINDYSFNQISLTVNVTNPDGAWLYYADAKHPGWHAEIDHKTVPIYPANLAFKAIFVPSGSHSVRFFFWNDLQNIAGLTLAFTGILYSLALLTFIGKKVLKPYV